MKTLTPDRSLSRNAEQSSSSVPQNWEEFNRLYPVYEALTRQLDLGGVPYAPGIKFSPWPDRKTRERDLLWLNRVDREVQAVDLRQFLMTPAVAREESLRVFLQRHLAKPEKSSVDRDKIDLLVVQYFVLCAPQELIAGRVETGDVAEILRPVLGEVETEPAAIHERLDPVLQAAEKCGRLRDLMEQGLLEQGKLAKGAVGEAFYQPAALVAVCRFNFLLRRIFIQWLHADLRAIGTALTQLEKRGVKSVDCRRAGLSSKELTSKLRQFQQHWKPPFQSDYSRNTAFQPYEQLMCLREDLEEALVAAGISAVPAEVQKDPAPENPRGQDRGNIGESVATASPDGPGAPSGIQDQEGPDIDFADVENLEEKIWEQVIATPPVRGRSMTTVSLENARILLSAWEVAAFVSDSGPDSEDLRQLIVARALLSTAIDRRKRLMDVRAVRQAVSHARSQVPRFQERVDQLKRTMKTDGAVNLGISLKRLLSLIEEGEQLQQETQRTGKES